MATLTIHNIDPDIKAAALKILKGHGMTANAALSAFLSKIVSDHGAKEHCFCCNLDLNEETRRDLAEAKAGNVQYVECKDTGDLFNNLGI